MQMWACLKWINEFFISDQLVEPIIKNGITEYLNILLWGDTICFFVCVCQEFCLDKSLLFEDTSKELPNIILIFKTSLTVCHSKDNFGGFGQTLYNIDFDKDPGERIPGVIGTF